MLNEKEYQHAESLKKEYATAMDIISIAALLYPEKINIVQQLFKAYQDGIITYEEFLLTTRFYHDNGQLFEGRTYCEGKRLLPKIQ